MWIISDCSGTWHTARSFIKLIVLIIFTFSNCAAATTYFVNATQGKDVNDGQSEESPWKTIAKVNSASFQPGDVIRFKRGETWREQLRIRWSGIPDKPITFTAYGNGNLPLIHGGTIIPATSWTGPDENGVYVFSLNYEITGFAEDNVVLPYASDVRLRDGNWYLVRHDPKRPVSSTIFYKPTSGTLVDHIVDRNSRGGCITFDTADNSFILIQDLGFFLCSGVYGTSATKPLHDVTVRNCNFDHAAIGFFARNGNGLSHIKILGNTISNAAESIFVGSFGNGPEKNQYVEISGNIIKDTGLMAGKTSYLNSDKEGIGLQNIEKSTISHNEIFGGAHGGGISFWTNHATVDAIGNRFFGNYIHDIMGAGIIPGGSGFNNSSATVTNNVIMRCGTGSINRWSSFWGGIRLNRPQKGSSLIANNVVIDCDVGIYFYSLPDNYIIENNFIVNSKKLHVVQDQTKIKNNVVNHNIYY